MRAVAASFGPPVDHPDGCFVCQYFGEPPRSRGLVRRTDGEHVRSQAHRGCAFWEREPGADDEVQEAQLGGAGFVTNRWLESDYG
jgi:hypothetical protein